MKMGNLNWTNLARNPPATSSWGGLPLPRTRLVHSPRSYFKSMLSIRGRKDNKFHSLRKLGSVSWPPLLRQLFLAWIYNDHDMDWEGLPSSLERLALGGRFNQPIESATWPVLLKRLTLGGFFNQRITGSPYGPVHYSNLPSGTILTDRSSMWYGLRLCWNLLSGRTSTDQSPMCDGPLLCGSWSSAVDSTSQSPASYGRHLCCSSPSALGSTSLLLM